jgi:hypothetical protein
MATIPAVAKTICQGIVLWALSTVETAMNPPTSGMQEHLPMVW